MMRALIVNPVLIAAVAALGFGACKALHLNPHLTEMAIAAVVMLIASEAAMAPTIATRGRDQASVAQAALISMVVHLLIAGALGAGVSALLHLPTAYLNWLLAFYWATLAGLSTALIRAVRSAPMATPTTKQI